MVSELAATVVKPCSTVSCSRSVGASSPSRSCTVRPYSTRVRRRRAAGAGANAGSTVGDGVGEVVGDGEGRGEPEVMGDGVGAGGTSPPSPMDPWQPAASATQPTAAASAPRGAQGMGDLDMRARSHAWPSRLNPPPGACGRRSTY